MCLQCVFSSFSTDSGCTVELVDSSTTLVHYSTVFNRSTNIAEGCITDVTSGLYDIRVYDQGSNVVGVTVSGFDVTHASSTLCSTPISSSPAIASSSNSNEGIWPFDISNHKLLFLKLCNISSIFYNDY